VSRMRRKERCVISADVWFQRDLANALLSVYAGKVQTLEMFGDDKRATAYHAGIRDTISALALLLGISPAAVIPEGTDLRRIT